MAGGRRIFENYYYVIRIDCFNVNVIFLNIKDCSFMFQLGPLEELVSQVGVLVDGVPLEPGQGRPREGVTHSGDNTAVAVTNIALCAIIKLVSLVGNNAT